MLLLFVFIVIPLCTGLMLHLIHVIVGLVLIAEAFGVLVLIVKNLHRSLSSLGDRRFSSVLSFHPGNILNYDM